MKVLIIEDEKLAADQLARYLHQYDPQSHVLDQLTSVSTAVSWLRERGEEPDLILLDIQLTDGTSFSIFDQVKVSKPIIFTTAFDEYAIDAFKVNSIDYLLKPVSYEHFCQAIQKWASLQAQVWSQTDLSQLVRQMKAPQYKERFVVKMGVHIHAIPVSEVVYFYAEGRTVFLVNNAGKKYIVDYTLEQLEQLLNPGMFFRVNRSVILAMHGIQDIVVFSKSRLQVYPEVKMDKQVIVSREKVSAFKEWLGG